MFINKIVRICVAGKPFEDIVSLFTYMDQEKLNFAWQGNFARNWLQALTVLRPGQGPHTRTARACRHLYFGSGVASPIKHRDAHLCASLWCLDAGREALSWVV